MEIHDQVPTPLPDNSMSQAHSRVPECDGRPAVRVEPSPVNRMITASAGVQPDLWFTPHVDLFAIRLSELQSSIISSPRPTCLRYRCSEHKLVRSHCLCLPSHGSPSQGDPKN